LIAFPNGPKQLTLGSLEQEILEILWAKSRATAKEIHEQILADPDRELAIASVMTVLKRLVKKGWVSRQRQQRVSYWQATVSQQQAQALQSHDRLQQFLEISNPDLVMMFADRLGSDSVAKLEQIAQRLKQARLQHDYQAHDSAAKARSNEDS
jgi:predicted transcriptional regulator